MREVNGFFCRLLLLLRRDGYRNCKCPKQRSIVETSGEMLNRHIASYALIRSSEKRDQELSSPDKIFDRRLARQLSETHMSHGAPTSLKRLHCLTPLAYQGLDRAARQGMARKRSGRSSKIATRSARGDQAKACQADHLKQARSLGRRWMLGRQSPARSQSVPLY